MITSFQGGVCSIYMPLRDNLITFFSESNGGIGFPIFPDGLKTFEAMKRNFHFSIAVKTDRH